MQAELRHLWMRRRNVVISDKELLTAADRAPSRTLGIRAIIGTGEPPVTLVALPFDQGVPACGQCGKQRFVHELRGKLLV